MKANFQLTIAEILKRKHFDKAAVIAGEEGLGNCVKWVHVVEVTNIENLLNGSELILSTGVAWKECEEVFVEVLNQLIENGAAGLCVELGTYLTSVPESAVNLANEHHFPIIVFKEIVPFVDITQDIHSLLINQQYKLISDLENYSQSLNKSLLTVECYTEILHILHNALGGQIVFKLKGKEYEFVPEPNRHQKKQILHELEKSGPDDRQVKAVAPIFLFGKEYADLYLLKNQCLITDYDLMLLDRTTIALAQHLMRDLFVEEKKRVEEYEWLNGWLEGEYRFDSLYERLSEHDITSRTVETTVLICKYSNFKNKLNQDVTYLKLLFRSYLEQQGFIVFLVEKRNQIVFILLNQRVKKNTKERIIKAIEMIQASDFIRKQPACLTIGIGKFVGNINDLHKSYQAARDTITIQEKMSKQEMYHFYEDLHLYRLISMLNNQTDLQELVNEYLNPIIQYDLKNNGKLLETLKVYLECNGSKQETANKLYVVRQTLYHRLKKLESLIGTDFMLHEKRVALEFMLLVNDYLSNSVDKRQYHAR